MYLFNSKLVENKKIKFALTAIFGLGGSNSLIVIKKLGFCSNLKLKMLSKNQILNLIKTITSLNILLGNELKKIQFSNLKKALEIKLLKSFRKIQGLPIRGQRTHTNAKTARKKIKIL
jgi:small subunit ribosomal protein S13|uniref:Small ribosomal subunit protein uS13m n=1 Tax=Entomoneis sp. TaxID=186043 RepID=A0A3G1PWB5_9STRA|nr:ribosomal protein S13 [Entomoneis sp.]